MSKSSDLIIGCVRKRTHYSYLINLGVFSPLYMYIYIYLSIYLSIHSTSLSIYAQSSRLITAVMVFAGARGPSEITQLA